MGRTGRLRCGHCPDRPASYLWSSQSVSAVVTLLDTAADEVRDGQRRAALDWIQCSCVGAGLGWEWVDGRVSGARTWLSCADLDRSLTRCLVVRLLHELTQTSLRADPQGLNTDRKRRRPAPSTAVCGPVPNLRETRASDRIGEGQLSDPA
jgi:hypothetical protein